MGNIIRELIQREIDKGVKQIALARGIGISQSSIQKILYTDTKHTLDTIKKVAAYFKIPLETILAEMGEMVAEETAPHYEELKDDEREMLAIYREAKMYGVAEDGKKFFRRLIEAVKEQSHLLLYGRGEHREGETG